MNVNPVVSYDDTNIVYSFTSEVIPPMYLTYIATQIWKSNGGLGGISKWRYSLNGGQTYYNWEVGSFSSFIDSLSEEANSLYVFQLQPMIVDGKEQDAIEVLFERGIYPTFFEFRDLESLNWAFNVFEKLYFGGVLPFYVNKKSEDFSSFWIAVTHFFSFVVTYARQYQDIPNSASLFAEFISQRGLVINDINTLELQQYIFSHYVNEFKKRGTFSVFESEQVGTSVLYGEFLRLIGYTDTDEFMLVPLSPSDIGWCLGKSSPLWAEMQTIDNADKGKCSLDNYPLYNNPTVENNVLTPNTSLESGIGYSLNTDLTSLGSLFTVNSNQDYEVSFKVSIPVTQINSNPKLTFGVCAYSYNGQKYVWENLSFCDVNETASNNFHYNGVFLKSYIPSYLVGDTIEIKYRGIIKSYLTTGVGTFLYNSIPQRFKLPFNNGFALKWNEDVNYACPYITQSVDSGVDLTISEVRFRPIELEQTSYVWSNNIKSYYYLNSRLYQGYMGKKNLLLAYIINNSTKTIPNIIDYTQNNLISYKNKILIKNIITFGETNPYIYVNPDSIVFTSHTSEDKIVDVSSNITWNIN